MMGAYRLMFLVAAGAVLLSLGAVCEGAAKASTLTLSYRQVPRRGREGKTTPFLDVDHARLGPVCELQCYETGPFQHGVASKNDDGSVVFTYESGDMACSTTFTTRGGDRVQAATEITGPFDDVEKVPYLGACLQFQRSQSFTRQGPLQEFARRCFIYTMRGPVMGLDTARGKMTNFEPDAPENNPPMVQWYVPIERMHPGDIWGVVGTAGDRPLCGLVACTSRDGKWVTGYAAEHNRTIGQLYMPCIHVVPDVQKHLDVGTGRISYREIIYVMPNDPQRLLEAFHEDFPPAPMPFGVSPAADGALLLTPTAQDAPALTLTLNVTGGDADGGGGWKTTWWGTLIRSGKSWRAWAHPHHDALEVCVSLKADSWEAESSRAVARLTGEGWTAVAPPDGTAAQVMRSTDGTWTACLFWERADADDPAAGVPAADQPEDDVVSVRGRIIVGETRALDLSGLRDWAGTDWQHAKPYRMPVDDRLP